MLTPKKLSFVILLFLIALPASSGLFNDLEKLGGMTVLAAGDVRAMDCPSSMRYDCSQWPTDVYEINRAEYCFSSRNAICGTGCSGILAVDERGDAHFFAQSRFGGDFTAARATPEKCLPQY